MMKPATKAMTIWVEFFTAPGANQAHLPCGPYRMARMTGNSLWVSEWDIGDDGGWLPPFVLANRLPTGKWIVNGLNGLTFESVQFWPLPVGEKLSCMDEIKGKEQELLAAFKEENKKRNELDQDLKILKSVKHNPRIAEMMEKLKKQ